MGWIVEKKGLVLAWIDGTQDPELNFEQAQNPKGFKQSACCSQKRWKNRW